VAEITKAVWMSVKSAPTIRVFNGNTCLQTDFPDNDTAVSWTILCITKDLTNHLIVDIKKYSRQ